MRTNQSTAIRVSAISIVTDVILSSFKLTAGIVAGSMAMISDAVHSASDVLSTFIVMIGVKMAGKKSDKKHPFGHERFECVAALILAVMLCAVGFGIGYAGVTTIINADYGSLLVPGTLALAAAVTSLIVKEFMYWFTRYHAKKINSSALMADAWHHRSDALSSVGSFAGILGARLGFPLLDPIASLLISLLVVKAGVSIFMDAIRKMTDESAGDETESKLSATISAQKGVLSIFRLRTRKFGDKIYIEAEIGVSPDLTVGEACAVSQCVHDRIEEEFGFVKHIVVTVKPQEKSPF